MVSHRGHAVAGALIVLALTAAGIFLYYEATNLHVFPTTDSLLVRVAIALAIGVAAILALRGLVGRIFLRVAGPRRASLAVSFFELAAYCVLAIVVLLIAGVSSIAVLAGGTFAGLVLGLAAQTVLSNVIAGVMLLFVRPMEPGERVTLSTWQYGLIAPAYPPKFYSNETLLVGLTGTVADVGIVYTSFRMDDGTRLKLPNSIVVQAAVFSHELSERWVRTKYELPPDLDPKPIVDALAKRLPDNNWVVRPELLKVYLASVTLTSSVVTIDAMCRGSMEDPPRSALLFEIREVVQAARAAAAPPGPKPSDGGPSPLGKTDSAPPHESAPTPGLP
jgi:small conductance mechanosensitive channel